MGIRTIVDSCGNGAGYTDKLIGDAYKVVRHVSEHIEYVKHVSAHMAEVYRLTGSIDAVDALVEQIDKIDLANANLTEISTVADNIAAVLSIYQNIATILEIHGSLPELLDVQANMATFLAELDTLSALDGRVTAVEDSKQTQVTTLAALKALDTTKDKVAYLSDAVREKLFVFKAGDYSAQVAADTAETMFVAADGVLPSVGAWVWSEWAAPISWKEVKYNWFGGIDHPTTDQVPVWDKIRSLKTQMGAEPLRVLVPKSTIALNTGAANVPVELDGFSNLEVVGKRGSTFKKTVAQRELFYGARTTKCTNLRFIGFDLDGGNIDDTDNNWPLIMIKEGDGILYEDLYVINASTALRVGFSAASVSASSRCIARNNRIVNPRYHGIEFYNTNNSDILHNYVEGGAASVGITNRGIRMLQSYRGNIENNRLSNLGNGIVLNTDANRANDQITVRRNSLLGMTATAAIYSYFALTNSEIVENHVKCGNGPGTAIWIGQLEDPAHPRSSNVRIAGNTVEAGGSETTLIRVYGCDGGSLRGNRLLHLGRALASSHYAARLIACGGKWFASGNEIEMDDADCRGIYDVSGAADLQLVVNNNDFVMASIALAVNQSVSAGTLYLGGEAGDNNTYVTRT